MDSFYDAPRQAPVPQPLGKLVARPMVPDVSLLCHNKPPFNSYTPSHATRPTSNKENWNNVPSFQSQYLRKHVRFESPILQQTSELVNRINNDSVLSKSPRNTNFPSSFSGKTFDQIYLANVPSRQLDLSTIEVKKPCETRPQIDKSVKENAPEKMVTTSKVNGKYSPKNYKQFRDTKQNHNDSVTDIFHYKPVREEGRNNFQSRKVEAIKPLSLDCTRNDKKIVETERRASYTNSPDNYNFCNLETKQIAKGECGTQTSNIFCKPVEIPSNQPEDEPTVKDLLKIISQQNEQLLMLQKQVATLINCGQQKQLQDSPKKYITSTQHENFKPSNVGDDVNPPKKPYSKFSIDLMTSFEVSFRPQQHPLFPSKTKDFYQPKIQEITETSENNSDSSKNIREDERNGDNFLRLQEPLKVVESCPSPEPSIKISMNDYNSSEDDDDDDFSNSDVCASFYKNLMEQVNKILMKAQVKTNEDFQPISASKESDKTMHRVKEATLKHLRSIGVVLPQDDVPETIQHSADDSREYNPTEISFVVKQLLMKYLPAEQLAKIKVKKSNKLEKEQAVNPIACRPEFSFASIQYMKKYNLLATAKGDIHQQPKAIRDHVAHGTSTSKILDISKLKNQPKLL